MDHTPNLTRVALPHRFWARIQEEARDQVRINLTSTVTDQSIPVRNQVKVQIRENLLR